MSIGENSVVNVESRKSARLEAVNASNAFASSPSLAFSTRNGPPLGVRTCQPCPLKRLQPLLHVHPEISGPVLILRAPPRSECPSQEAQFGLPSYTVT